MCFEYILDSLLTAGENNSQNRGLQCDTGPCQVHRLLQNGLLLLLMQMHKHVVDERKDPFCSSQCTAQDCKTAPCCKWVFLGLPHYELRLCWKLQITCAVQVTNVIKLKIDPSLCIPTQGYLLGHDNILFTVFYIICSLLKFEAKIWTSVTLSNCN